MVGFSLTELRETESESSVRYPIWFSATEMSVLSQQVLTPDFVCLVCLAQCFVWRKNGAKRGEEMRSARGSLPAGSLHSGPFLEIC